MPANVETCFSVREVPWHGLGIVIEEAPDSQKALELAGLDWRVDQVPVYVNGNPVEGYLANVRSTDQQVLGIVSDQYKVVQNAEAFAFTDALLGEGVRYETAGSLAGGKRVWMLARLERTTILNDRIDPFLVFTNSHDGKGAVKVAITPVRVVCQNTLNLALHSAKRMWTTIHMGNMQNKLVEAQRTLGLAYAYLDSLTKEAERLVNLSISDSEVQDFIDELLPFPSEVKPRQKDNIIKLREDLWMRYDQAPDLQLYRGTRWALINAVSDFATHAEPLRKTTTYKERLFAKTIDGHPLIDKAFELLVA